MFYNKFTGIIRSFYFLNENVSQGNNGLWGLELTGTNSLLNNIGYFAKPSNISSPNPIAISSNISILSNTKSIAHGWNVFDTEITYDPTPVLPSTSMRLLSYDQNIQNISLTGDLTTSSDGTIISTNSKNTAQTFVNNTAKAAGSAAKDWVKGKVGSDPTKTIKLAASIASTIVSGGVTEIINAGVNLLFGSFIGKKSSSTNTEQKIEFKTNGTLTLNGTITSSSGNNVSSAAGLWIPGSVRGSTHFLSPFYNSKLGVWNLKKAPVVIVPRKAFHSGEYSHDVSLYLRTARISASDIDIAINPAVISEISNYTVTTNLFHYNKFQGETTWNGNTLAFANSQSVTGGSELFNDGETVIYSHFNETFTGPKADDNPPPGELTPMPNIIVNDVDPRYVVKVTVTLFPKSGYNQDPIVITRSYLPEYRLVD